MNNGIRDKLCPIWSGCTNVFLSEDPRNTKTTQCASKELRFNKTNYSSGDARTICNVAVCVLFFYWYVIYFLRMFGVFMVYMYVYF